MADWFESRFREPADGGPPDPAFAARVRALVVEEWRAGGGWTPSGDTDPDEHEGDIIMLDTDERPPTGNPTASSRRPPGRWLAVAAAVAVVAVIAGLVAAGGDDEDEIATGSAPDAVAATDVMSLPDFQPLEPGTYSIDPDADPATPLTVTFEVADEGWAQWLGAVKFDEEGHIAVSITTIENLVREGCQDHGPADPPVGPTVDDLATALTRLKPFEVSSAPRDVTVLGYAGKHLQLTVPDLPVRGTGDDRIFSECANDSLHSWISSNGGGSFYGYNGEPGRTEDYWILDVEGTRLALITTFSPASPPQDVAELQAIFDSIRIQP